MASYLTGEELVRYLANWSCEACGYTPDDSEKIARRKTKLALETPFLIRRRAMIAHVEPWGLRLREKGCRQVINITWAQIYNRACQSAAEERRAARRKGRKR